MAAKKKAAPKKDGAAANDRSTVGKIADAVTGGTAKMVAGAIAATAAVAGAVYAGPTLARKAGLVGRGKAEVTPSLPENARTRRKAARMQHREARRAKAQSAAST